jgi:anti-anti-sigma factor
VRLVQPPDPVFIEHPGELALDRMSEGCFGRRAHRLRLPARRVYETGARGVPYPQRAVPPFELEPQETEVPNVLHVGIAGELDLTNARELEDRIEELSAGDASILVLDLNRVVFIDSAALHVLFRASRTGRIGIVLAPTAPVARTVEIVGLAEATVVGESLEAVLATIDAR